MESSPNYLLTHKAAYTLSMGEFSRKPRSILYPFSSRARRRVPSEYVAFLDAPKCDAQGGRHPLHSDEEEMSIGLMILKREKYPILVQLTVSLIDTKQGKRHSRVCARRIVSSEGATIKAAYLTRAEILSHAPTYLHPPNGALKLVFDVLEFSENTQTLTDSQLASLSPYFPAFFDDGSLSDFTLAVAEREFKVHKSLLADRSVIFKAMLESTFEETEKNRFEFKQFEVQVIEAFIWHLYDGRITDFEQFADQLLVLAEMYQVSSLKATCENILESALSIESFVGTLQLAVQNSANKLKGTCLAYFKANGKQIMATEDWQILLESSGAPANREILDFLLVSYVDLSKLKLE